MFGPQGADFVSKDLLLEIQKIAKARNTKIHMHTQQGDRETYQVVKRYNKNPIEWLKEIGYLDETLIAVHLTDANDEEAGIVAKSGASMILCPGSIGIIDGKVILRDGKVTAVNEEDYYTEVGQYTDGIGERASEEFWKIIGTNALFMREEKL